MTTGVLSGDYPLPGGGFPGIDDYDYEDVNICAEEGMIEDNSDHKPTKAPLGRQPGRKKTWPSMELQTDENQSYKTSHIIVTTDDTYNAGERLFLLACIHCELYLSQKKTPSAAAGKAEIGSRDAE